MYAYTIITTVLLIHAHIDELKYSTIIISVLYIRIVHIYISYIHIIYTTYVSILLYTMYAYIY